MVTNFESYIVAAISAEWQDWSHWSQCTASCGQGLKMRARACSEPSFGDHVQCLGDPTEVKDCSSAECPGEISHLSFLGVTLKLSKPQFILFHSYPGVDGEWQEWGEWSHCDPSCSCARKFRYRACTAPLFGGNDCVGDPTETAPCSDAGCCSSTVSRIRTSESFCENTTSPG